MNDVIKSREESKQRLERKTDWRHEDYMEVLGSINHRLWWVAAWLFAIFLGIGGK